MLKQPILSVVHPLQGPLAHIESGRCTGVLFDSAANCRRLKRRFAPQLRTLRFRTRITRQRQCRHKVTFCSVSVHFLVVIRGLPRRVQNSLSRPRALPTPTPNFFQTPHPGTSGPLRQRDRSHFGRIAVQAFIASKQLRFRSLDTLITMPSGLLALPYCVCFVETLFSFNGLERMLFSLQPAGPFPAFDPILIPL